MDNTLRQTIENLWSISDHQQFNDIALEIFRHQVVNCPPYNRFCSSIGRSDIQRVEDIPFLPIGTFKNHAVKSSDADAAIVFESSGTTGMTPARHHVVDMSIYEQSYLKNFTFVHGRPEEWCVLALLPSYLERGNSSLVSMANGLISKSKHPASGFFLDDLEQLSLELNRLKSAGQRTMLIGVSFALIDMAEQYAMDFPELCIIETGGMKGRKEELTREALHSIIGAGFGVEHVQSEYGMTELLSQAYATRAGRFSCPPWMRVSVREADDPFQTTTVGRTGGLNVIDLANVHSCSFVATDDLARQHVDGTFEVVGRFDQSDIRGCSLLSLGG